MMGEQHKFENSIHIRWRDIDSIGHVNNAIYFSYFEDSRAALLKSLGLDFNDPEVFFILAHIECDYYRPILMDAEIAIGIQCIEIGGKSFTFAYSVLDTRDGTTIYAKGKSVQVCFDPKTNKAIPVSDKLRACLERLC